LSLITYNPINSPNPSPRKNSKERRKRKMQFTSKTLLLALLVGTTQAFTTTPFGLNRANSPLFMADEAAAPSPALSGLKMKDVRSITKRLTTENFSADLAKIEPFLMNEVGATFYGKAMSRIASQASALGVALPAGYAKEATATAKRREKQNGFIQIKIEKVAEAAAAAAVAAEEAEAAAKAEAEAAVAATEAEAVAAVEAVAEVEAVVPAEEIVS
jgi:hypothetical protein